MGKLYRLKKDIQNPSYKIPSGSVFASIGTVGSHSYQYDGWYNIPHTQVEGNTEWFEEINIPPDPTIEYKHNDDFTIKSVTVNGEEYIRLKEALKKEKDAFNAGRAYSASLRDYACIKFLYTNFSDYKNNTKS